LKDCFGGSDFWSILVDVFPTYISTHATLQRTALRDAQPSSPPQHKQT
jgi:hypothetical protein